MIDSNFPVMNWFSFELFPGGNVQNDMYFENEYIKNY